MFIHPSYGDRIRLDTFETMGRLLIAIFVMGRMLSILYIGQHKNKRPIATGPYSLCRNPLHLFSIVGVLGFGLMLQSLVVAVFISAITFLVYFWNIKKEEEYLSAELGEAFSTYARSTLRLLPASFAK